MVAESGALIMEVQFILRYKICNDFKSLSVRTVELSA